MGIMETFLNGYNSKEMKKLVDLLMDSTTEMCEQKRKAIAYLYLKISILTGISLEEAFERYAWKESTKDADYITKGNRVLVASAVETTIYLVPRTNPMVCRLPYREMAYNLLEMVRKEFRLPKDEDYGIQV